MRSQGAYFEGDSGIIILYTMFLVSYIFFNKCLYFSLKKDKNGDDNTHIVFEKLNKIMFSKDLTQCLL